MPLPPRRFPIAACLLPMSALAPHLCAQIPTGAVVILQGQSQPFGFDSFVIADPAGGGATVLPLANGPLLLSQSNALATDPNDATQVFLLDGPASFFPGLSRAPIGALAFPAGPAVSGQWSQSGGERLVVGSTRLFTLRTGGIVEATQKSGGAPLQLLQLNQAIDLALAEPFVYVAANDPSQPAPLVEFSLQTGAQRVIGNYVDVHCVARSRSSNALAVGTGSGLVLELDLATGNVANSFVAGPGAVRGLAYTAQDDLVFVVDSGGAGYTVWSELSPSPIFVGTDGWKSLSIATAATASVVEYGAGCGVGNAVGWDATTLPTLGNLQFRVQLQNTPIAAPLALLLGGNRLQSNVLGAPLPFDLQPFGAAGCRLLTDPEVPLLLTSDAAGNAAQTIPIPALPGLSGVDFQAQALVLDPGVPFGLATTTAIVFRIL